MPSLSQVWEGEQVQPDLGQGQGWDLRPVKDRASDAVAIMGLG